MLLRRLPPGTSTAITNRGPEPKRSPLPKARVEHRDYSILQDSLKLYSGLHSVQVVIQADKRELKWGKNNHQPRARFRKTGEGSFKLTYDPLYKKRFLTRHLRLIFIEPNHMIIAFEPGDLNNPYEGGLLPFYLWNAAWSEIRETIEEAVGVPGLFERPHRLKGIELATDIWCPFEPAVIANSLMNYPVSKRYLGDHNKPHKNQSVKYGTKKHTSEFSVYDRTIKSKGKPVARLEFRLLKSCLDTAFGLSGSEHVSPEVLESKDEVDKALSYALKRYSIFKGVKVVPLHTAKRLVTNERIREQLDDHADWRDDKKYRYYVNRLREIEGLIVGTDLEQNVVSITDLYEGIIEAYERSWEILVS